MRVSEMRRPYVNLRNCMLELGNISAHWILWEVAKVWEGETP